MIRAIVIRHPSKLVYITALVCGWSLFLFVVR